MKELDKLIKDFEAQKKQLLKGRYIVLPIGSKTLSLDEVNKAKQLDSCLVLRVVEEVQIRKAKFAIVKKEGHLFNNHKVEVHKEYKSGLVCCRLNGKSDAIHKKFLEFIV